jgi:hypothetical protein
VSQALYKKRLYIVLVALALNGCAVWDAYFMTSFDNQEYMLITQIRVDAQVYKGQCGNHLIAATNAQNIFARTNLFEKYSEKIPKNDNGIKASRNLNEIAQGLAHAYVDPKGDPSATFCRLKYGSIENAAYVIQTVVGDRPR